VVDSCLEAPPATAPGPGEPQPEIVINYYIPEDFDFSEGIFNFVTIDESVKQLFPIAISNKGEEDLIVKDAYTAFDFEYDHWNFENTEFPLVVRPSTTVYLYYDYSIIDIDKLRAIGRGVENRLMVESNDPRKPLSKLVIGSDLFQTISQVPESSIYIGELPQNPLPPDCADINGDGAIDAADTIQILLGE